MKVRLASQRCAVAMMGLLMGLQFATTPTLAQEPFAVAPTSASSGSATPAQNWREQYAYSVGMQAYVYAFPLLYLTQLRHKWTTDSTSVPYSALNHFYHFRNIPDASYKAGGSPNNDTLYSWGFFDLSKEPVVLAHPDMGKRYFTFEIADMYSNNVGYVGKRTTGSRAGAYLIAGPGWQGKKPSNVLKVIHSRTPYVLVFGRTFVNGPDDVAAANKLQDQYRVVPLSLWGKSGDTLPESRDVWAPFDPKADPLADWKTINRAMTENPPAAKDRQLLEMFATVGIGPGLTDTMENLDTASKKGLAQAAADGPAMVEGMLAAGVSNRNVNGWLFPPQTLGRQGAVDDDFRGRAVCSVGGIICNDADEAVYIVAFTDSAGEPLDGTHRYTLRFEKGGLPPAHEFWSLTLYGADHNLVANSIGRYAIRDRTPGVKTAADGSITLYLQPNSPGPDLESNWLPTPKNGPFNMALRSYVPGESIRKQRWQPPTVKRIE